MPNNGRLVDWKALKLKCLSTGNYIHTGAGTTEIYFHQADAATASVPNIINVDPGISLHAESGFDGTTAHWSVTYNGPGAPFGGFTVSGSSYLASVSIEARPQSILIYGKLTGSLMRLVWASVDIWINGAFYITLPFSGVDLVSNGTGPNYIPLIGEPVALSGSVTGSISGVPGWSYDTCDPSAGLPLEYGSSMVGTAEGGWEIQEWDDTWHPLPIEIYYAEPPSGGGCPFGLSGSTVDGADTISGVINLESSGNAILSYVGREAGTVSVDFICETTSIHVGDGPGTCHLLCDGSIVQNILRDVYSFVSDSYGQTGSLQLVPNLEKLIEKLGSSYRALWYRNALPEVKAALIRRCTIDGVTVTYSDDPIVYEAESVFLGCVGPTPHAMEDAFSQPTYSPMSSGKTQIHTEAFLFYNATSACVCPPSWVNPALYHCPPGEVGAFSCGVTWPSHDDLSQEEHIGVSFPSSVSSMVGGDYAGGYQWHLDPLSRYLATWPNPHWHYLFFTEAWEVEGAPELWADYWGPIEEQWLYNAALPLDEQRKTRNSMIMSMMENEQGNGPFLDAFAAGFRWIGISRFKIEAETLGSSITLDQTRHGEWNSRIVLGTPDIGSITYLPGSIHLSGLASTSIAVDLEFGSWTEDPFLLLYRAYQVTLGWNPANIVSVALSLVGYDGSTTSLGASPATYSIGSGNQSKYAGSWGLDNGNLIVSDAGTDSLPSGISSSLMGDPEAVLAFQLATGRTYKAIRFTIEVTSSASPVDLNYPSFALVSDHPSLYWENSKACAMLWPDHMGLRWGNWAWYIPGIGFLDPPLVAPLGTTTTIIDWKAFRHRFLRGDGGASLASTITSELSSDYDFYEGQSIPVVDKLSRGILLPKSPDDQIVRGAMVNSFSEFPPFACFPYRKRAHDWTATGDFAQVVYDMCEETRPLISPSSASAQLTKPDDTLEGSFGSAPSGWSVWEYAPILDNTEVGWKIKIAGTEIALTRPWSGYFCVYVKAGDRNPAVMQTSEPRYVKATVSDGHEIIVRCAGFSIPPYIIETVATNTGDCDDPCLAPEQRGSEAIILFYSRSNGNCYERRSYDYAKTWDTESMAFAGAIQPKIRTGNQYEIGAAFRYVAGTSGPGRIPCVRKGEGDTAFGAEAYWKDDLGAEIQIEDTGFDFCFAPDDQNRWTAAMTISGEAATSDWYSTDDCLTWIRV